MSFFLYVLASCDDDMTATNMMMIVMMSLSWACLGREGMRYPQIQHCLFHSETKRPLGSWVNFASPPWLDPSPSPCVCHILTLPSCSLLFSHNTMSSLRSVSHLACSFPSVSLCFQCPAPPHISFAFRCDWHKICFMPILPVFFWHISWAHVLRVLEERSEGWIEVSSRRKRNRYLCGCTGTERTGIINQPLTSVQIFRLFFFYLECFSSCIGIVFVFSLKVQVHFSPAATDGKDYFEIKTKQKMKRLKLGEGVLWGAERQTCILCAQVQTDSQNIAFCLDL